MKAAAPLASSFVSYLLGLSVFGIVVSKAKQQFAKSKYAAALGFLVVGLFVGGWAVMHNSSNATAFELADDQPENQPVGVAKGIYPGRVVWIYDPEATNQSCTNQRNDFWSDDKNTDQDVVSKMVSASIQELTGTSSDATAWDSLFHYYNRNHNRGNVGYTKGEMIVIKINLNGLNGNSPKERNINTSPQICYSVLNQLVNVVGVDESDIYIGDPGTAMTDVTYARCHDVFTNVNYMGTGWGQYKVTSSGDKVFHYSDGESAAIPLPKEYVNATYLINIPVFKKHHRAGISICAKNHVGTINIFSGQNYANADWHKSLPTPFGAGQNTNGDYGVYRDMVDIMGHKDLGGKTVLYLVDGIWGSTNWGHPAVKWQMAPFNNDWPNSLFTSLDPVALESVCYDFLYYEFDENNAAEGGTITDDKGPFPHFNGVDDYLHQAADPTQRPADIQYDPNGDGNILGSLGTHEHWNNAVDKQYSRNLSSSGTGIDLHFDDLTSAVSLKSGGLYGTVTNYPNPVMDVTTLQFDLEETSQVQMNIYALNGQKVNTVSLGKLGSGTQSVTLSRENGLPAKAGQYIYRLEVSNSQGKFLLSNKMLIQD